MISCKYLLYCWKKSVPLDFNFVDFNLIFVNGKIQSTQIIKSLSSFFYKIFVQVTLKYKKWLCSAWLKVNRK